MEKEENNSRRNFLKTAATGAVLAAVTPAAFAKETVKKPVIIPPKAKGANDRIRVAVDRKSVV
jgi:hypothetical protein